MARWAPQRFLAKLDKLGGKGNVQLRRDGPVVTLALQHAARRNALSPKMITQLATAVDELEADAHAAALLITGDDGHFCSGFDLETVEHIATPQDGEQLSLLMTSLLERIRNLPMLSVACIDGAAYGGGAELATATDWRVASCDARIRFVQAQMCVGTGLGGAARLVDIVGRAHALNLLCRSHTLDAEGALAWGFADVIAGRDDGSAADVALAKLARPAVENAGSAAALRVLKLQVANASRAANADVMMARESSLFASVWGSPAHTRALDRVRKGPYK